MVVIEVTERVCVWLLKVVGGGEGKKPLYVLGDFWVLGVWSTTSWGSCLICADEGLLLVFFFFKPVSCVRII